MTPRLLMACVVLAAIVSAGVNVDADLWWHLDAGREALQHGPPAIDTWSYTAAGRPWIHHEWVYGSLLAVIFDGAGTAGLLAFRFGWLTLTLVAMATAVQRRTEHENLTLLLVGLPFPLIALLSNLRPQTATWALVPVAVVLLDRVWDQHRAAIAGCVALVWLWVNLHGGFLFGWGLLGLGLLTSAIGLDGPRQRLAWAGILGLLIVPMLNPYGLELLRYVATEITVDHPDLPEWQPPGGVLLGVVVLLCSLPVVLAGLRTPQRWAVALGFLVACLAALRAAKFIQLLLLLAPILLAPQLRVSWLRLVGLPDGDRVDRVSRSTAATAVLVVLLGLVGARFTAPAGRITIDPAIYPVHAVAWLQQQPEPHRLLVLLGWGGLAHHHLPGWTLSMDGRNTTVYEPAWVQAHTQALLDGDLATLSRGEPEVALVRTDSRIGDALEHAGWTAVHRTPVATVWTRIELAPVATDAPDPVDFAR